MKKLAFLLMVLAGCGETRTPYSVMLYCQNAPPVAIHNVTHVWRRQSKVIIRRADGWKTDHSPSCEVRSI